MKSLFLFTWTAFDSSCVVRQGLIWREDLSAVAAFLHKRQMVPISMRHSYLMIFYPPFWWMWWCILQNRNVLSFAQVSFACRALYVLMSGGFSLYQSLEMVGVSTTDTTLATSIKELCEQMASGLSVGESCRAAGKRWPEVFRLALDAVQGTGKAPEVLAHLAEAFDLELKYRGEIKKTLLVPLITGISAVVVFGFAIYVCSVHSGTGQQIVQVVTLLYEYSLYGLAALIIMVTAIQYCVHRFLVLQESIDFIVLYIPFLGDLIVKAHAIVFFTLLSLLLRSGVALVDALRGVIPLLSSAYQRKVLRRLVCDLECGVSLSEAVVKMPQVCMPSVFVASVVTAINAAQLAVICQNTAQFISVEREQVRTRFILLLQPVFMIFIGCLIAAFVQMLYRTLSSSLLSLHM